jgi:hypothetical protein
MRRYLVVAHQTLASAELIEAMQAKSAGGDAAFHLVVPIYHGDAGLTWTESRDRAVARGRLDEAIERMSGLGIAVTGEVGSDSPVDAADDVLRRDGHGAFDGIIVSTLPRTISKWLKLDAPTRLARLTRLPVDHVVGHASTLSRA